MYKALVHSDVPFINNKQLWKMKVPLKIKIFSWYLRRGVILTKDNLAKRNWQGSTKCVLCHHDENIMHLFFQCSFARSIWAAIQVASNLYPPSTVTNIFSNWLHGIDNTFRNRLRVGAIALLWSLWLCRNDRVFNAKLSSPMHVIFLCSLSPGVVYSSASGTPRPVYGGLLAVGASGERYFYPAWVAA